MSAIPVSSRARAISDSITLAITARAKAMRAEGIDVVSLGAGEPDFPTPDVVADAGCQAIRDGHTRYTAAAGVPALREAASKWFGRHFGLDYAPEEVVVTAGAKPALTLCMMTLLEDGERVLLPGPYWASYPDIVRLGGGVPIDLAAEPEQGFIHTGAQIGAAAKEHGCKGVVLNYPNNPSGAVPTRAQVEDIVAACVEHDLWILSDEIYARLIYDGAEHVSPASIPGGRERTVVVNGGTKSHSMTGWRVGFLAAPKDVATAVGRIVSQAMGNTCSISQQAALAMASLEEDAEFDRRMVAFDERRHHVVKALDAIEGIHVSEPKGAFYALIDVRDVCAKMGCDDVGFAEQLLIDGLVATVPGSAFAIPGFVRISYAASIEDLDKAIGRIREFVASKIG